MSMHNVCNPQCEPPAVGQLPPVWPTVQPMTSYSPPVPMLATPGMGGETPAAMANVCFPGCEPPMVTQLPDPFPSWGGGTGITPPTPVAPIVTGLVPPSAPIGGADMTLEVKGSSFTSASVLLWDGAAVSTIYVNSTTLRTTIRPSIETAPRQVPVTARTDTLTATTTLQFQYTDVVILPPAIYSLVPNNAVIGAPDLVVTANGANFTPTTTILWDGVAVPTNPISATQVSFTVSPGAETVPRTVAVTVQDGTTPGTGSVPFAFTATAALRPTLTSVVPDVVGRSDAPTLLTFTGTNFTPETKIIDGSNEWTTTYISPTELDALADPAGRTASTVNVRARTGTGQAAITSQPISVGFWSNPVINLIDPSSAPIGGPDIQLRVAVQNPAAQTILIFDGVDMPTVSEGGGIYRTTIKPSLETAPRTVPVSVRIGHVGHPDDDVRPVASYNFEFT
jgi:hypothetical protein